VKINNPILCINIYLLYLGTTPKNQNSIQKEIKSRLQLGNALRHSVENLVSSSVLPKNTKIKMNDTVILTVVMYEGETWSLTLWEVRRLKLFENRVLRRIFGLARDEVTVEWRKLHNEELNDLYSPRLFRVIKSRRMTSAEHVAFMGESRNIYRGLVARSEGKNHLGDPGVDGRTILRWIFRKLDVGSWTGSIWLRIGTVAGTCECGSIKCEEFLD